MKEVSKSAEEPRVLAYRPCVGIMVLNRQGLVFIGKRRSEGSSDPSPHAWQMPQGGIHPGEDPYEAARRELFEETNIRSISLLAESKDWHPYDLPSFIEGRPWKGRYRGQMQKWFAFRFFGGDEEIDILRPAGGAHRPEFEAWRWESMERLPDLIIPFKRRVYEKVVADFEAFAGRGG